MYVLLSVVLLIINCNVRSLATPTRCLVLGVVLVFDKGRRKSSNTYSRCHISLRREGCQSGNLLVVDDLAEERDCEILSVCFGEHREPLHGIILLSAHQVEDRHVLYFLGTHQLQDVNVGNASGFEVRNDLVKFWLEVVFGWLHFT